ncbi:MAG: N-acetylmuramoyl-L-alanine amidase [Lachnospiraceae bacterium]|nr:N-acetylmuramoyl-L-alanine amidase [Lachnospiraceae bacterium]
MGIFSPVCTQIYDFGTKKSNLRSQDGISQPTKIIIHHMAGTAGALACAKSHLNSTREASANCYIKDDDIVGAVSENRRAWTSGGKSVGGKSGRWADFRGITIEVSNNRLGDPKSGKGWTISAKSYRSLVRYCADVCKRYGIIPHYDGTQNGTLCMHKQFAATACPGEMLEDLITSHKLEEDILTEMGKKPDTKPEPSGVRFRVQIGAFKSLAASESFAKTFSETGKTKGLTTVIKKEGVYYKVQHPSTGFDTKADAELSAGALKQMGHPNAFVVAGN